MNQIKQLIRQLIAKQFLHKHTTMKYVNPFHLNRTKRNEKNIVLLKKCVENCWYFCCCTHVEICWFYFEKIHVHLGQIRFYLHMIDTQCVLWEKNWKSVNSFFSVKKNGAKQIWKKKFTAIDNRTNIILRADSIHRIACISTYICAYIEVETKLISIEWNVWVENGVNSN